ncbi:MAG: hypothetical protein COA79_21305, partial [Planctomycetota bacterium]
MKKNIGISLASSTFRTGFGHKLKLIITGRRVMKKLSKPFTLIELMIVVAIIAIIAVIAVPNLMDAQRNAKERSSIGNLKTVMGDQAT